MNVEKKNRTVYLDMLRIIAVLEIITVHIPTLGGLDSIVVGDCNWWGFNLWRCIAGMGDPLFIMISGAIWCNPKRDFDIKRLYLNNIKRLVIAFIFWCLVYNIFTRESYGILVSSRLWEGFFKIHWKVPGHFGFILMILGIYILLPGIRRAVSDEKTLKYYVYVFALFVIVIPSIVNCEFFELSENLASILKIFDKNYSCIVADIWLNYGFFILGYYLSQVKLEGKFINSFSILMTGICALGLKASLNYFWSCYIAESYINRGYDRVTIAIGVISEFLLVRYVFEKKELKESSKKILSLLAENCFGIYILHIFAFSVFLFIGINAVTISSLVAIPLIALVTASISFLVSATLRKTPLIKKTL